MYFKDVMHGQKFIYMNEHFIKIKKFNNNDDVWNALTIDEKGVELSLFEKRDWVHLNEEN